MTRSEKYRKVIPVWPQLEATVPSDVVGRSSDCENRANEEKENKLFGNKRHGGSCVSHVPCMTVKLFQNECRYV